MKQLDFDLLLVRDQGIRGSNPLSPTIFLNLQPLLESQSSGVHTNVHNDLHRAKPLGLSLGIAQHAREPQSSAEHSVRYSIC